MLLFIYYKFSYWMTPQRQSVMFPNGISMNGLRRNDDAMKNYRWYQKKYNRILFTFTFGNYYTKAYN
jgi:hypothetical protein